MSIDNLNARSDGLLFALGWATGLSVESGRDLDPAHFEAGARYFAATAGRAPSVVRTTGVGDVKTASRFVTECCEEGRGLEVAVRDLYEAYQSWAVGAGVSALSSVEFGRCLVHRGIARKTIGSTEARKRGWVGVALRSCHD